MKISNAVKISDNGGGSYTRVGARSSVVQNFGYVESAELS